MLLSISTSNLNAARQGRKLWVWVQAGSGSSQLISLGLGPQNWTRSKSGSEHSLFQCLVCFVLHCVLIYNKQCTNFLMFTIWLQLHMFMQSTYHHSRNKNFVFIFLFKNSKILVHEELSLRIKLYVNPWGSQKRSFHLSLYFCRKEQNPKINSTL